MWTSFCGLPPPVERGRNVCVWAVCVCVVAGCVCGGNKYTYFVCGGTRVVKYTHLEQGQIAVSHNQQSMHLETCHPESRSWTEETLTAD